MIIYTCVTGGYDYPPEQPRFKGVRYVCLTDQNLQLQEERTESCWEFRPLLHPTDILDNRLINRWHKINYWQHMQGKDRPLKNDHIVYIDGNIRLKQHPQQVFNHMVARGACISAFSHPERSNIFEELGACISLSKLHGSEIPNALEMTSKFISNGMPAESPLAANYVIFRRDNNKLRDAMETWWNCVSRLCRRDQISFPYAMWRHELAWLPAEEVVSRAAFFSRCPHGDTRNVQGYRLPACQKAPRALRRLQRIIGRKG